MKWREPVPSPPDSTIKCECDEDGVLEARHSGLYDPVDELPFVNHKPGECRCTNDLRQYRRNGKTVWLCSNCCQFDIEE